MKRNSTRDCWTMHTHPPSILSSLNTPKYGHWRSIHSSIHLFCINLKTLATHIPASFLKYSPPLFVAQTFSCEAFGSVLFLNLLIKSKPKIRTTTPFIHTTYTKHEKVPYIHAYPHQMVKWINEWLNEWMNTRSICCNLIHKFKLSIAAIYADKCLLTVVDIYISALYYTIYDFVVHF